MPDSPFRASPQVGRTSATLPVRAETQPVSEEPLALSANRLSLASVNDEREAVQPVSPATSGAGLLLRPRKPVPQSGFRRLVHVLTGGAVNPGLSAEQLRIQDRRQRLLRPLHGCT